MQHRRPAPSTSALTASTTIALLLVAAAATAAAAAPAAPAGGGDITREALRIPLHFEPSRPPGTFRAGLTSDGLLVDSAGAWLGTAGDEGIRLEILGARRDATPRLGRALPGVTSRFVSTAPHRWRTGLPHFDAVTFEQVLPGIDVRWRGSGSRLEHDFLLDRASLHGSIRLRFDGIDEISLADDGALVLHAANRTLRLEPPMSWHEGANGREPVQSAWRCLDDRTAGFALGAHEEDRPLVIDPVLDVSTYFGGVGTDFLSDVAVAPDGSIVAVGASGSPELGDGVAGGISPPPPEPGTVVGEAEGPGLVARFSADGTELLALAYLGGGGDEITSVAVRPNGGVVVVGRAESTDLPTLHAPYPDPLGREDAFVAELSAGLDELLFSTRLGGSGRDWAADVALAADGRIAVTGTSASDDVPTTGPSLGLPQGAPDSRDVFLCRLSSNGRTVEHLTLLGGAGDDQGNAVAFGPDGRLHLAGFTSSEEMAAPTGEPLDRGSGCVTGGGEGRPCGDGFLLALEADGRVASYRLFGGSEEDSVTDLSAGPQRRLHAVGTTRSSDLPTSNAWQDRFAGGAFAGFVARFDPTTLEALTSTYLAPTRPEDDHDIALFGVAVDAEGRSLVAGHGVGASVPLVGATQEHVPSHAIDAYVATLSADGASLDFSTWHGGGITASEELTESPAYAWDHGAGIAVDADGAAVVVGYTMTRDLPVVQAMQDAIALPSASLLSVPRDGFVAKFAGPPQPRVREPSALDLRLVPPLELRPSGGSTLVGFEETMSAGAFRILLGSLRSLWTERAYDHEPVRCDVPESGATVDLPPGDVYVLVQAVADGKRSSLGRASLGSERPPATADCP